MKLLIQPGAGIGPILKAIHKAKKSIEIVIFRFDRKEVEKALEDAVERGVFVHALIAYTNRGGEEHLRALEMRLLERGVTVARTADDLVRYHGKMMIADRKELHLLGFNWTMLDIERSRSFGIITRNRELVAEAVKLFEADTKRQPYKSGSDKFVVSPVNSREVLSDFIAGAKRQILIYDVKVADRQMLRLLEERRKAGVEVRILGGTSRRAPQIDCRPYERMRLHVRTIIRDGAQAFLGSQSLKQLELDGRREIGMITRDRSIVAEMARVFEEDWKASDAEFEKTRVLTAALPARKAKKKIVKAIEPVLGKVVEKVVSTRAKGLDPEEIHEQAKEVVKQAVKEAVKESLETLVEPQLAPG
ncbi:MAG: phosphatidylserine synthase [Acidobacteriales bacterium]|nr:phosphatidylserine synthase [Terriglobales bacterium]